MSIAGNDVLSYEISGMEYRTVCNDQIDLLTKAGWEVSAGFEMDVDGAMIKTLQKNGYALTVTCGDNTEEGSSEMLTSVALNRTKQ